MAATPAANREPTRSDWDKQGSVWRWRILVSILGPVAWLSFTLLYVGFWAPAFTLFQSIIVILVSIIILAGLMGAIWATWGSRFRHGWD